MQIFYNWSQRNSTTYYSVFLLVVAHNVFMDAYICITLDALIYPWTGWVHNIDVIIILTSSTQTLFNHLKKQQQGDSTMDKPQREARAHIKRQAHTHTMKINRTFNQSEPDIFNVLVYKELWISCISQPTFEVNVQMWVIKCVTYTMVFWNISNLLL